MADAKGRHARPETDDAERAIDPDVDGPFDIDDFDDPAQAELGRLDLGSVLVPMPETAQLQVDLTQTGAPSVVWVITANGRFTIAAFAAPKSAGLWREVATELADALRSDKDTKKVAVETGPWGREVVGVSDNGNVRFIGVDGYRWMIRCVVNGPAQTVDELATMARNALADTVVRRGDTPLPVRTPLAIELPEVLAAQLREASAQQAAAQQQQQTDPPQPTARRAAPGSAMQQLRTSMGG